MLVHVSTVPCSVLIVMMTGRYLVTRTSSVSIAPMPVRVDVLVLVMAYGGARGWARPCLRGLAHLGQRDRKRRYPIGVVAAYQMTE